MPSEQRQLFFDEKQTTFQKDYDVTNEIVDTTKSVPKPKISESNFHCELKNVKIHLPKVNIPNKVLLKHEVDKYRKLFQSKPQTARKSISLKTISCVEEYILLHKSERAEEEGVKMSAKILNFNCSQCQDSTRYSPNDLQKHFQMWHRGELPSYPCEMCSFSASDFQVFKQHRRTHRSTLVKCDICNNENVYTLLDLIKHFTSTHCVNGSFQCEKCKFSTLDVGTFVQHIHRHNEIRYKCGKCHHVCFTKGELQKHLHLHSGTFPYACQCCSYGATRREYLITLHKEHLYAKEKLEKDKYEKRMSKTSAGLKLILKRYKIGTSRKTLWKRKKIGSGSDRSVGKNTQVLSEMNKTQTVSENQSHLVQEHLKEDKDERLPCENNDKPTELELEKPALLSTGQCHRTEEGSLATSGFLNTAVQGPTLLMVKNNKITVPANFNAKFMGFKMVDGKQHIVIKLLPTNKQNLYPPGLQMDAAKDSNANLQPQTVDTTGFLTGITTELSDTVVMKTTPVLCSSPIPSGNVTSEKETGFMSQRNNMFQTMDFEKSMSSLPATSELVTASVNLTTKVETRDNVDMWENSATQSHSEVLDTASKSPDKVSSTAKPNTYNNGDMHNYCVNHFNPELTVECSKRGSLPFHNYSKMNNTIKRRRFSRIVMCENPQREPSSSKTVVQQPISESVLSLVRKESSKPDSFLPSVSLLNDKDGTLKTKADTEEECVLEKGQNSDEENLYTNENQNVENVAEQSKWEDISSVDTPMMPRITSVFSLQSQQASEFLPPEVNQLLQDELKAKPDIKQDSNSTNTGVPHHCNQLFQKLEGEVKPVESSNEFKVPDIFPVTSGSVGINVPANDLNVKYNGKEKQVLQDLRDSEKLPRISSIGALLKTQSDAIITQQLVKDKLRATTQNVSSLYVQSPLTNSEPKKAIFVQTPKGLFIPLHVASKPGLHVVSGRPLPLVNTQSIPASLLLNKKPGMILTFNSGKCEGLPTVKTENAQACGTLTKEPCKTPLLKVEQNSNCLTPALCSSIGSCLSMKSSSENTLPLKGPYVIKTPASSSVKTVPTPNRISEHQGTKLNILDPVKQQNEIFPKQPLYTLLPDGKQAVFLKCVMPNKTELLKPKLVQNSTYYQNIQPKKPEGTPQKILLKIFNPILNVTAANSVSVSNSASSLQKDNVSSTQTIGEEQKEPESPRDALPLLVDDLMPANEIVITSSTTCPESAEEPVCMSNSSEARVLRCKTKYTVERSFSRRKTSKKNFSEIKTHVSSKGSETVFVSRNRNCKRKCRDSYQEPPRKKSTLHRKCKEKTKPEDVHDALGFTRPRLSKDSIRTLRLFPFSSRQLVKCPRRNQPVVVLNHPDADAPEVANVMKTVAKFNGHVLKVSLSKRTMDALLKPVCCNPSETTSDDFSRRHRTFKPVSSVKERFVLKLTLKKTSKNNYQIVKTTSENVLKAKFNCWFCGRVFDNQDAWAGHGQRHLMEATRDWNMLEGN